MMPIEWVKLEGRAQRRTGPHVMNGKMRKCPWPYCTRCGLVALWNDATRAALKRPCVWTDDAT